MDFSTAFEKAFGRAPTPEELDKVLRVKHAFGVDDNDALMTIAGLLVFHESGAQCQLQEGARLLQSVVREEHRRAAARPHTGSQVSGTWRVAMAVAGMWAASVAFVGSLALSFGASMNRGHPCWVPKSAADSIAVTVLGAPTGWLVLIASLVPATFAGAWALLRGMDEGRSGRERWLGWVACAAISVALLSWFALVLVKVPRV